MRGLKVHLRLIDVGPTTYRVVSLRPATRARFSTNYFHDTWHVITSESSAGVLARVLWGLSFQRQPGTVFVIDAPHLVSTPFDGDPARPALFVPAGLAPADDGRLRELAARLRRGPAPTQTIRWHTFGLPEPAPDVEELPGSWRRAWTPEPARPEQAGLRGGFVCFTAPAERLRALARSTLRMGREDYLPVAETSSTSCWHYDGEIQTVPRFDERVRAARVARREELGEVRSVIAVDEDRWRVWDRADRVLARRRRR